MKQAIPQTPDAHRAASAARPGRCAFTLVELMVVIAVVVLLLGLGIAGMALVQERTLANNTRNALAIAKLAEAQFHAVTDGRINHDNTVGDFFDWDNDEFTQNAPGLSSPQSVRLDGNLREEASGSDPADLYLSSERFVVGILSVPSSAELLGPLLAVDGSRVVQDRDGDGFLELWDGWDTPMQYRTSASREPYSNPDYHDLFNKLGMVPYADPYLASAGPDGLFGQWKSDFKADGGWEVDTDNPDGPYIEDNLYSFDMPD